ncbi:heme A synthase [Albidovulum sediminicola]|uniref:Heme A synthase n=1 Tax=Albidovulum sediminicola TaxID=2984331 RepID=A0ABT2YZ79_9RHOB|nr:heme A synthase [Defluviimonas sp. WL0075]MCV2864188.1 COX15/CtaA family protein [Defluviimonas sp. WL0075]
MAGQRKLFEEVGSESKTAQTPQGGMIDAGKRGARGGVRAWLAVIFVLVVAMIAVGGLTRLTDSGLSITEWRPVTGAVPPMTEADWQAEFAKYQSSPEFQLQNHQMGLEDFKSIYWWEWGHRQLGRVIGLVWALGFVFFWVARRIPVGWTGRLLALGGLGGLQGAIGWWMVSSGLTGRMVDVASYRLATHLGLAFAILGLIAWYVLSLSRTEAALMQARRGREGKLFSLSTGLMHLTFVQILLGALVAGIDAGRAFPTWPLMGDSFFPADAFYVPDGGGSWRAFFENPGLVQFVHRMVAYLALVFGAVVWWRGRGSAHPLTKGAFDLVGVVLLAQVILGIFTVLHAAPLGLGLAHQLGAVALWVAVIRARHRAQYPIVQSVRGAR